MESSLERHVFPKFCHPGNMGVFGPSKSGKTTFLQKLVQHRDKIFRFTKGESELKSVVYYYGSSWQPVFQTLSDEEPSIQFRMGYPKNAIREEIPEEDRPALVTFDDLEREIEKILKPSTSSLEILITWDYSLQWFFKIFIPPVNTSWPCIGTWILSSISGTVTTIMR